MQVSQVFSNAGMSAYQGEYFRDPETGVSREIDVICLRSEYCEKQKFGITLQFIVECKHTSPKPWVVFSSTNFRRVELSLPKEATSESGQVLLKNFLDRASLPKIGLFNGLAVTAYGVVRSNFLDQKKEKEVPFDALSKLSTAIRHVPFPGLGLLSLSDGQYAKFNIPLIVVEGALYQARLAADESLTVEQVPKARVLWKAAGPGSGVTIDIVTFNELKNHVDELNVEFSALMAKCEERPELIADSDLIYKLLFSPKRKSKVDSQES